MKMTQKGFTLIELMIVVAIIGILAAVAIPAYQDYVKKSRVAEVMELFAGLKTGIGVFYAEEGTLPADDALVKELGLKTAGNYCSFAYSSKAETLTATVPSIDNNVIVFSWDDNTWVCDSANTTVPDKYLPKVCK